jgi:hypothetical protein
MVGFELSVENVSTWEDVAYTELMYLSERKRSR